MRKARFRIERTTVEDMESLKYLGLRLERNLSMIQHIQEIADKDSKYMKSLEGLLPNKEKKTRECCVQSRSH